jgi:hypothetical protein
MQFKFDSADKIVSFQIVNLLIIVHIVYFNLEFFLLLEVILS